MYIKCMDTTPGVYKNWPSLVRGLLPAVLAGLAMWALIIYGLVKLIQVL